MNVLRAVFKRSGSFALLCLCLRAGSGHMLMILVIAVTVSLILLVVSAVAALLLVGRAALSEKYVERTFRLLRWLRGKSEPPEPERSRRPHPLLADTLLIRALQQLLLRPAAAHVTGN